MATPKTITCDNDWLRDVILGKIKHQKCPNCDNEGFIYSLDGESYLNYPHLDWGNDYFKNECENCDGVGFIEIQDNRLDIRTLKTYL